MEQYLRKNNLIINDISFHKEAHTGGSINCYFGNLKLKKTGGSKNKVADAFAKFLSTKQYTRVATNRLEWAR